MKYSRHVLFKSVFLISEFRRHGQEIQLGTESAFQRGEIPARWLKSGETEGRKGGHGRSSEQGGRPGARGGRSRDSDAHRENPASLAWLPVLSPLALRWPHLPFALLKVAVSAPGAAAGELGKTRAGFMPTSRTGGEATESGGGEDKKGFRDPGHTPRAEPERSFVFTMGDLRQRDSPCVSVTQTP